MKITTSRYKTRVLNLKASKRAGLRLQLPLLSEDRVTRSPTASEKNDITRGQLFLGTDTGKHEIEVPWKKTHEGGSHGIPRGRAAGHSVL